MPAEYEALVRRKYTGRTVPPVELDRTARIRYAQTETAENGGKTGC